MSINKSYNWPNFSDNISALFLTKDHLVYNDDLQPEHLELSSENPADEEIIRTLPKNTTVIKLENLAMITRVKKDGYLDIHSDQKKFSIIFGEEMEAKAKEVFEDLSNELGFSVTESKAGFMNNFRGPLFCLFIVCVIGTILVVFNSFETFDQGGPNRHIGRLIFRAAKFLEFRGSIAVVGVGVLLTAIFTAIRMKNPRIELRASPRN